MVIATQDNPPAVNAYCEIHLLKINTNGSLVKSAKLDTRDSYEGRVAMLSPNLFLATWYKTGISYSYRDRCYLASLKPKRKYFVPVGGGFVGESDVVKLLNDKGAYQICSIYTPYGTAALKGGNVYGQYIKSNGKPSGKADYLFGHDDSLVYMRAAAIPGSNDIFVVWEKWIEEWEIEIWGFAFSTK